MTERRTDRRDVLKKAAVGGVVAWTTPVLTSVAAAGATGTGSSGCEIVPIVVPVLCGPGGWRTEVTFDEAACPGAIYQLDMLNGVPISNFCNSMSVPLETASGIPFVVTYTMTLRDACNGTVLAGPITLTIDAAELCSQSGDAPAAPTDRRAATETITVTLGDRTIEIPAGDRV